MLIYWEAAADMPPTRRHVSAIWPRSPRFSKYFVDISRLGEQLSDGESRVALAKICIHVNCVGGQVIVDVHVPPFWWGREAVGVSRLPEDRNLTSMAQRCQRVQPVR